MPKESGKQESRVKFTMQTGIHVCLPISAEERKKRESGKEQQEKEKKLKEQKQKEAEEKTLKEKKAKEAKQAKQVHSYPFPATIPSNIRYGAEVRAARCLPVIVVLHKWLS